MSAADLVSAADEVLAKELDSICASGGFRHAPQQQRLLRHLFAKLKDRDLASLREMALGIEVFRRPAIDFDPKKDPIVRVEVRRLRDRLARYYALEGEHAAIEIVVPIGSYVPVVRPRLPSSPVTTSTPPSSIAAALLERAWYVMRLRTIEGNRKALELFSRACIEYPECAPAFLGVAWARVCLAGSDGVPPEAGSQREAIRVAIDRARSLAPEHAHVAVLSGAYAFRFEHAVGVAEEYHRAGLDRAGSDPFLLGSSGWLFALTGRFDEAEKYFEAAHAHDPFGFWLRHNRASLMYLRRDFDAAETILREALEIEPDHAVIRMLLARVLMGNRRGREAVAETAWCKAALPGMSGAELEHVTALARAGDMDAANLAMRDFERDCASRYVSPVYRAMAHVALGNEDAAMEWLARAATQRDYWLPNVAVDPAFDRMRSRPDFVALLQAAGLYGPHVAATRSGSGIAPQP